MKHFLWITEAKVVLREVTVNFTFENKRLISSFFRINEGLWQIVVKKSQTELSSSQEGDISGQTTQVCHSSSPV